MNDNVYIIKVISQEKNKKLLRATKSKFCVVS